MPSPQVSPGRPSHQVVLAIDFGLRRMGVAAGQTVTRTAHPIAALRARAGQPDWPDLNAIVQQWQPERLLVGLPLNMDGTESEMSGRARHFAGLLQERYARPVELVDERLTTIEAKRASPGGDHDALAAGLIAETWLRELP